MPPTPCFPPPLLLCSLLHKNFSPHKVHVWIWSLYSGLLCLHIRLEAGGKEKTPPSLSHLLMSFFFFFFFSLPFFFCWFIFPKSSLTFWHLFSSQNRLFIPELLTKSPQSVCHLVTCPDFMVGKGGLVAVATRRAFIKKVGGAQFSQCLPSALWRIHEWNGWAGKCYRISEMDESRNTFALKRHDVMLSALQFLGEVHLLITMAVYYGVWWAL